VELGAHALKLDSSSLPAVPLPSSFVTPPAVVLPILPTAIAPANLFTHLYAHMGRAELATEPGWGALAARVAEETADAPAADAQRRARVRAVLRRVLDDSELFSFLRASDIRDLEPGERAEALLERLEIQHGRDYPPQDRGRIIDELTRPGAGYLQAPSGARLPERTIDALTFQATGVSCGRYLVELRERSRRLYTRLFPEVVADFPITVGYRRAEERNASQRRPDENGVHGITFFGPDFTTHSTEDENVDSDLNVVGMPKLQVPRRIDSLVTFFHEMAHGVFDRAVPVPDRFRTSLDSAFYALTEGFAVMLELVMIDRLSAARVEFGLSDADVSSLRASKRRRIQILRRVPNHLTEGTFHFWHGIYKRAGVTGMMQVLERLDPARVGALNRNSMEYRLIQDSPELFEALLTKDADQGPRRGFTAMHKAVMGNDLSEEEREAAADFLGRVRPSALRRLYSGTVGPRAVVGGSPEVAGLMFRLSNLATRAPSELVESLLRWTADFRSLHALFLRGPQWTQTVLQGMEAAKMDADQRLDWNSRLALWSASVAKALPDIPSGSRRSELESIRVVVDAAVVRPARP
jgi:hypothetical protein